MSSTAIMVFMDETCGLLPWRGKEAAKLLVQQGPAVSDGYTAVDISGDNLAKRISRSTVWQTPRGCSAA